MSDEGRDDHLGPTCPRGEPEGHPKEGQNGNEWTAGDEGKSISSFRREKGANHPAETISFTEVKFFVNDISKNLVKSKKHVLKLREEEQKRHPVRDTCRCPWKGDHRIVSCSIVFKTDGAASARIPVQSFQFSRNCDCQIPSARELREFVAQNVLRAVVPASIRHWKCFFHDDGVV